MYQSTLRNHANKPTFESKWDEIYSICLRIARHWSNHPAYLTYQDLAQDAAIKVLEGFDEYDGLRPLTPFVYETAHNAIVDEYRTWHKNEISFDEFRPATSQKNETTCRIANASVEDEYESNPIYSIASKSSSIAEDLEPLLCCLPWRQRLVIEMSFGLGDQWWEKTDERIAEELGITRQTVSSDRKKAIEEMQIRVGIRTPRVKVS